MPRVLFLCSGNYYRSRFAEILFNDLTRKRRLDWQAESRGFRLSPANVGPISKHTIHGLQLRGIEVAEPRHPRVVEESDFASFELVIAVKEAEHRAKMQDRFPHWADRIEYWHIHDLDCAEPDEALVELQAKVTELVDRIARDQSSDELRTDSSLR
jgi:protein-tyrosine phosphatase